MKIRQGFVSNSSSSSFVIGLPFEMSEEKAMEVLGLVSDSPLKFMADRLMTIFEDDDYTKIYTSVSEYLQDVREEEGKYYSEDRTKKYAGYRLLQDGKIVVKFVLEHNETLLHNLLAAIDGRCGIEVTEDF